MAGARAGAAHSRAGTAERRRRCSPVGRLTALARRPASHRRRRSSPPRTGLLCGGLLLLAALAVPLPAQELVSARVPLRSPAAADALRRLGIDVVVVRTMPSGAVAEVVISPRDRAELRARGWVVEEVARPPLVAAMEARRVALGAAAYSVYRDYDDSTRGVAAHLRAFAASRGNVALDTIGLSLEGRRIVAVKVGPAGDSPSRPNVIFVATYHAREWAATEMALRLLAFLADSLPARPGGAALLASRDVWVLPVVNPDGYQYTFATTRLWRKNRRANPDGSRGVDLNRNHDGFFALDDGGSSPQALSETYRGPSAESEPETRAVAQFHRAHPPVIGVSYHTYGAAVLYPWGHQYALMAGDQPAFTALGGTPLAPAVLDSVPGSLDSAYAAAPGWLLYPTNGDYDSWAYREFGTLAFTVELTSGCCLGGGSYGFEFPDDEALLARVFRDNLPFALSVIAAAGDPVTATGPSGLRAESPTFEAVWPEVIVAAPASSGTLLLDVVAGPGASRTFPLRHDSLSDGRFFSRLTSRDIVLQGAEAVRVSTLGLTAEVLARDGAERVDSPWMGFLQTTDGVEGAACWMASQGTLVSPEIRVAGRRGLRLLFWTRHDGSLGVRSRAGHVEVSTDGGTRWTEVWRVLGAAPLWYPLAVPLTVAEGASSVRVRFRTAGMEWRLDAITVIAGETRLFDATRAMAQGSPLEVSANPVRTPPVTLRWPTVAISHVGGPGMFATRIQIFTFAGDLVRDEVLTDDPGLWRWDLTGRAGTFVANGAYAVVVTRADGVRYRRRLFVLRSGS